MNLKINENIISGASVSSVFEGVTDNKIELRLSVNVDETVGVSNVLKVLSPFTKDDTIQKIEIGSSYFTENYPKISAAEYYLSDEDQIIERDPPSDLVLLFSVDI